MAAEPYLQYKRRDRVNYIDIVVLKVITEYTREHNKPPTRNDLFHRETYTSIVNTWLEEHQVDTIYTLPITGSDQLDDTLYVLRRLNLIEKSGSYSPTQSGYSFFKRKQVGENWRRWPISVPVDENDEINWTLARYAPEF